MIARLSIIALMAALLTGCWGEAETGPVDIHYGRDTGEYCGMIISDPRFAAEIRKAKGEKVFKFDDIGDAIHWLNIAAWKETSETEIWVRDMKTGKKWLDAHTAHYLGGQQSPMAYGFGAFDAAEANSVSFEEMRTKVLERGSTSRCDTPDRSHSDTPHTHSDVPASN